MKGKSRDCAEAMAPFGHSTKNPPKSVSTKSQYQTDHQFFKKSIKTSPRPKRLHKNLEIDCLLLFTAVKILSLPTKYIP
jgi:hypothetical protein